MLRQTFVRMIYSCPDHIESRRNQLGIEGKILGTHGMKVARGQRIIHFLDDFPGPGKFIRITAINSCNP